MMDKTQQKKSSGVLMHLSSLPSEYGIGSMGAPARKFVDFLKKAGQTYWQMLPICPTSYGDSPYQSFSTYAGNPYFIDLEMLESAGYLEAEDYKTVDWESAPDHVNYGALYQKRYPILRKAVRRFQETASDDYEAFCRKNDYWLHSCFSGDLYICRLLAAYPLGCLVSKLTGNQRANAEKLSRFFTLRVMD